MDYLENYLENNVEPTLSHIRALYIRGDLSGEDFLQIVSELTEFFEDYGEENEKIADEIYSKYAEEIDF